MAIYRLQHCFQGSSGDAEDRYCNTFYYTSDTPPTVVETGAVTVGDNIAAMVREFYAAGSVPLSTYLSDDTNNPGRTIKIYDVGAAPHTPPSWQVTDLAVPFPSKDLVTSLPGEVAVCLSFNALQTGAIRARRRGRVYVGPLNIDAFANNADTSYQDQRPSPNLMTSLISAGQAFAASMSSYDSPWCVYSRTDNLAFPVIRVSADNAFDTQRRRGAAPGTRIGADV